MIYSYPTALGATFVGAPIPEAQTLDLGDAAQRQLTALTHAGGGHAFLQGADGKCWGWMRVPGSGTGPSQWYGSKVASPVRVTSYAACALAKIANDAPYTPFEYVVTNNGWQMQVRLEKPWTTPKPLGTYIRAALTTRFGRYV